MVAAHLARVTGGGQAFRIGGEEFTILFPGKSALEIMGHLELLRATIEMSVFQPRGPERRTAPRGPERRKAAAKKKTRGGRPATASAYGRGLSVTVSIGVAEPASKHASVESVIELADKALYRAKANGRNRVELGPAPRLRARKKAAPGSA